MRVEALKMGLVPLQRRDSQELSFSLSKKAALRKPGTQYGMAALAN